MPDHDDDLVTVYSTDNQVEVAFIKTQLDSAEIRYIAANDVISLVYPVDGMAIVRFQVLRKDAAEAAEVLLTHGFK